MKTFLRNCINGLPGIPIIYPVACIRGEGGLGPPRNIVLLIVRIIENFQGIFVGVNELEIQKIGQFRYFVRTLWGSFSSVKIAITLQYMLRFT